MTSALPFRRQPATELAAVIDMNARLRRLIALARLHQRRTRRAVLDGHDHVAALHRARWLRAAEDVRKALAGMEAEGPHG